MTSASRAAATVVVDSNGPHAAALRCHACGAFRGGLAREAVHFLAEINTSFGTPTKVPVLTTDRRRVAARDDGDTVAAETGGLTNMTRDEVFPSRFLCAADLRGKAATAVIAAVRLEEMTGEDGMKRKPVMAFVRAKKELVLNVTNWITCAEAYGENSNDWIGKPIELYTVKTQFGARLVEGIRLRKPPSAAPTPAPAREPPSDLEPPLHDDSDIPNPDSNVPW